MFSRKGNISIVIGLCCGLLSSCGNRKEFLEPLPETVDFNFHIRPILVQNCYLCHGPDASGRKADLRLDTFEGATAALKEGGHAIVPGKTSKSKLIDRIYHQDEDMVMPPPDSNYELTERQKALLEKWIDQGAEWKPHWAFIPPETTLAHNDGNAIDSLINIRLRQKGLAKSPMADRNTLIRRVSYLLTGLPPSPKEIHQFLTDKSQHAYEKMVDRYLNVPAYGERWARHWMDLVRYAETKGHEFDYPIVGAYKYRDYLIRAFNQDVPYDQLLKEHLAGDLLEKPRENNETGISESQLGTAFYVMGEGKHSPVDIKKEEADRIDNMIDVTSKTFQGLTVSCAKCHDHKFDPITAADYYALYGIMESTRFTPVADMSKTNRQTAEHILDLNRYMRKLVADSWSEKEREEINASAQRQRPDLASDAPFKIMGDFRNSDFDGWITNGLAFGERTTLGNPLVAPTSGKLLGLDRGRASSKTFGTGIFGSLQSPNFILETDYIGVRARGKHSRIRIIIDNFQLIQDPIYGELELKVDSKEWKNYVFDISPWKGHKAYIEILPGGYKGHYYELPQDAYIEAQYAITYATEWPKAMALRSDVVQELNKRLGRGGLPSRIPELDQAMDSSRQLLKKWEPDSFFYGITDGFGINSPVFHRGDHNDLSKDRIPRRFLSTLPPGDTPFMSSGSGRMELAETLLKEDNPLTARVMVNRIWHHLFGKGIVETVDNFGLQGKLPSHPELLDHLAVSFRKEGWSIKTMIRKIVTTETFKRATAQDEKLMDQDPNTIYLASFPVRRLEAEAIRDGILAVSESLDTAMYGPPIKTYLTEFMQGRGRPYESGPLDGARRRSIYQEVRRNFLEPMMVTFDRPIPFSTFGNRNITNVPAQSLTLMNDPFVAQQAGIMAQKLCAQKELTFDQKMEWIYLRAFSRNPRPEEIQQARQFVETLGKMEKDSNEETEVDQEIRIWTDFCHSIFNLKEFIYLI